MRAGGMMFMAVVGCIAAGCAGYRLGPTGGQVAGARTVEVRPLANQTVEPRLGEAVTGALRRELQRDGTFRLTTREAGDIVVTGVITRFERREVSFLPDDVLTVQDYRVDVTARITARERTSGRVLLDQPVSGQTLVRVGTDMSSAERQALPLLARDLARNIVTLLAEGGW